MINYFNTKNGQSSYDLCIKSYGSMDDYINFCNDNGLTITTLIPKIVKYDTTLIKNRLLSNYDYNTGMFTPVPLLNNDGTPLLNNDGTPLYNNNYQSI